MNGSVIFSNAMWKFAERIMAQMVSLAVSVILARMLPPEDYGAVAMAMVFITVANTLVINGFPTALIQKKTADEKDFSSVFFFHLAVSLLVYGLIFLFAPVVAGFYRMPVLKSVLRVMGVRIVVSSVNSVQHAYVSRNMMFKKYFWSTFYGTVVSGAVGVAMAYSGMGVWALVAQYMVNTTVDTIVLFFTVHWRPILFFSWKRMKGMISYSWKILFESVSSSIHAELTNLIIGRVYTPVDLGCYTKAQQFPSVIVSNICSSLSSVLFPAIAAQQDDQEKVISILRNSVRMTSYVVFPMLTGLAVTAPSFINVVLTEKWAGCVPFLQIYCFLNIATVGMYPRHQGLNGTGRSDVFMAEHIFSRFISFCMLLMVYQKSVMAIAVSGIFSTLVLTATVMYTSKKYNGYKYKDQLFDVLPSVLGCVVMAVFVGIAGMMETTDVFRLLCQVVVGVAVYIGVSYMFRIQEFDVIIKFTVGALQKSRKNER